MQCLVHVAEERLPGSVSTYTKIDQNCLENDFVTQNSVFSQVLHKRIAYILPYEAI